MTSIKSTCQLALYIFFFCASNSCTEQKLNLPPVAPLGSMKANKSTESISTAPSLFNRNVGAPIDRQKGLRWRRNFAIAKPPNAETDYFLNTSALKEILSNTSCVGISLFYALDAAGQLIILPIGVDENGKVIPTESILVEPSLDWQTAWNYINNYSGKVKSHFSGAETYSRLLVDQRASVIRVSMALDDSGNPQLLMSDASLVDPPSYQDETFPCPPVCPN